MRRWWHAIGEWIGTDGTSLAIIPIVGERLGAIRRLRKGLRDARDRIAVVCPAWSGVAFGGLLSGNEVLVLVNHPGIARAEVYAVLSRRWPSILMQDVANIEPRWRLTAEDAAALAHRRRGIEPIRIVILPQRAAAFGSLSIEPLPVVL